jgi:guanylate kinase
VSAALEPASGERAPGAAAGQRVPRLIVLSAPSGAGKDTVLRELRRRDLGLHFVVPCTTRPRRPEEQERVDYRFLSREAFEALRAQDELLEHAEYAGHCYGTPKDEVRAAFARGEDALLKIEVQGAGQVKARYPQTVMIFLAPPGLGELERRLRARGVSNPADLAWRLARARDELAHIPSYDYLVINEVDRVTAAADQVEHIILAERCRVGVPPVRL